MSALQVFNLHWNEAYSAIRFPHLKGFVRFRIDSSGDLHGYSIGIDRTPHDWERDPKWMSTKARMMMNRRPDGSEPDEKDPRVASYGAGHPSKWIPSGLNKVEMEETKPYVVDKFTVPKLPQRVQTARNFKRMHSQHDSNVKGFKARESRARFRSNSEDFKSSMVSSSRASGRSS